MLFCLVSDCSLGGFLFNGGYRSGFALAYIGAFSLWFHSFVSFLGFFWDGSFTALFLWGFLIASLMFLNAFSIPFSPSTLKAFSFLLLFSAVLSGIFRMDLCCWLLVGFASGSECTFADQRCYDMPMFPPDKKKGYYIFYLRAVLGVLLQFLCVFSVFCLHFLPYPRISRPRLGNEIA